MTTKHLYLWHNINIHEFAGYKSSSASLQAPPIQALRNISPMYKSEDVVWFHNGSEIYGNTYQTHLSKLYILNNKILRILQNKPRHNHIIELYKTYNINTMHDIHKLQILILVHKFFHHI